MPIGSRPILYVIQVNYVQIKQKKQRWRKEKSTSNIIIIHHTLKW
jgi:hypothetical protein